MQAYSIPSIPRDFENRQGFGSMAQDALKILPGIEPPRPLPAGKLIVKLKEITKKNKDSVVISEVTVSLVFFFQVITHGLDLAAVAASWSSCGFSPSQEMAAGTDEFGIDYKILKFRRPFKKLYFSFC